MIILLISIAIFVLSVICVGVIVVKLKTAPTVAVSLIDATKLIFSGIVAFIADTVGVGSFAVNVALAKLFNTFPDDELPAVNNGAQVLPGMLESFFFLKCIEVDLTTLLTLVTGTCIGGLMGGIVVSRLSKQAIRLSMMVCFVGIIILLLCHQFHWMPVGGDVAELHSWKLILGFLAMIACGALTSVGIGLFAMVQGVLFLLNVSPEVAFPIMMTAGALQQPLTTLVFLKNDKIPLKKTLILSMAGCVGVLITLPLVTHLTVNWLHHLLLIILIYNFFSIGRAYVKTRLRVGYRASDAMLTVN